MMSQGDPPLMMGDHGGTAHDTVAGGTAVRGTARRRLVEDGDNSGGVDNVVGNNSRAGGIVAQSFSGHLRWGLTAHQSTCASIVGDRLARFSKSCSWLGRYCFPFFQFLFSLPG